jgi:hypothetical protein
MRQVTTNIYEYHELNKQGKAAARQWFLSSYSSIADYESVKDDAREIAALFGLTISNIFWSGFCSQGEGASFKGIYEYVTDAAGKVKGYAPQDTRLHAIIEGLEAEQKKHDYRIEAVTSVRGHYVHSGCMHAEFTGVYNKEVTALLRAFADWIYVQLAEHHEFLGSEQNITETTAANGYEFTADGQRYREQK